MKVYALGTWLPLVGYLFVAVVSIIAAFQVENETLKWLLIASAVVSLPLAIISIVSNWKTGKRIKYLEDNHLSITYDADKETLSFKEGIINI